MSTYADYLAQRNGGAAAAPAAPVSGGYAEYMAKRNAAPAAETPVPMTPALVKAAGGYAEYMATRDEAPPVQQKTDAGFAEYMATRDSAPAAPAAVDPLKVLNDAFSVAAAQYLAKRNAQPPVETPAPVAEIPAAGSYAEYMAKRSAASHTQVAQVAHSAQVTTRAQVAPAYDPKDPWTDPSKTVVSFVVDGVTKKYRVTK